MGLFLMEELTRLKKTGKARWMDKDRRICLLPYQRQFRKAILQKQNERQNFKTFGTIKLPKFFPILLYKIRCV